MRIPQLDDGLPVSWQQHATCRSTDPNLFFPTKYNPSNLAAARRYCQVCEVAGACLVYAIATGTQEGIWGGTKPSERSLTKLNARLALIG